MLLPLLLFIALICNIFLLISIVYICQRFLIFILFFVVVFLLFYMAVVAHYLCVFNCNSLSILIKSPHLCNKVSPVVSQRGLREGCNAVVTARAFIYFNSNYEKKYMNTAPAN